MSVRKSAMTLLCKILSLSSSVLMSDIVNAPAEQIRDQSSHNSVLRDLDAEALSAPSYASPGPRDVKNLTPDTREKSVTSHERIRARHRNFGLVLSHGLVYFTCVMCVCSICPVQRSRPTTRNRHRDLTTRLTTRPLAPYHLAHLAPPAPHVWSR